MSNTSNCDFAVLEDLNRSGAHLGIAGLGFTVVCLIGCFANFVLIWVFTRTGMREVPINFILAALAACDMMYLILFWSCQSVQTVYKYHYGYFTKVPYELKVLKLYSYPWHKVFYTVSNWYVVLASFERYIAICHPFSPFGFKTTKSVFIGVCSLLILSFCTNLPSFFEFKLVSKQHPFNVTQYDIYLADKNRYIGTYYAYFRAFGHFLIPLSLLLFLNGATMYSIAQIRKFRRTMSPNMKNEVRAGTMFLAYILMFLGCQLIPTAHYILESIYGDSYLCGMPVVYFWLKDTGHLFLLLNAICCFIVYFKYGTKFRRTVITEFAKLIRSKKLKSRWDDSLRATTIRNSTLKGASARSKPGVGSWPSSPVNKHTQESPGVDAAKGFHNWQPVSTGDPAEIDRGTCLISVKSRRRCPDNEQNNCALIPASEQPYPEVDVHKVNTDVINAEESRPIPLSSNSGTEINNFRSTTIQCCSPTPENGRRIELTNVQYMV